jgi:hypothetical protein
MKHLTPIVMLLVLAAGGVHAEGCSKSRDYLLAALGGELTMPPQAYADLFKKCLATAAMSNVKEAFILRDGAVAVIAKQNNVAATAATLSQFCDAYPRATLHFLTEKEQRDIGSIGTIVRIKSTSSTPCQQIKGLS